MIILQLHTRKVAYIFFLIIVTCNSLLGQEYPDNFKLGGFLEVFKTDSIKIFYDKNGRIIDKKCADYYRLGKIDRRYCNFKDTVKDYTNNSELIFQGLMQNNALNGLATYYYTDGKIKEIGTYENDIRTGLWRYYYPNGRLEKEFLFDSGNPKILTLVTSDGDTIINKGDGYYQGELYKFQSKTPFLIYGPVRNSLMDGKWTLSLPKYLDSVSLKKSIHSKDLVIPPRDIVASEIFEKGNFIIGHDRDGTDYYTQIIFTQGFVLNEYINFYRNNFGCTGERLITPPYYLKDEYFTGDTFFPELTNEIKKSLQINTAEQWLIIDLQINEHSKLVNTIIFSSLNDTDLENKIGQIIHKKFSSWRTAKINNKKIESNLFFTVIVAENDVLIPVYKLHLNYY